MRPEQTSEGSGSVKTLFVPIHRAGWPFIALFAAAAVVMGAFSTALGAVGTALTVWCVYFFRDPDRVTPTRPGLVVSPADGVVQFVDKAAPPMELEMGEGLCNRVGVFMNVFDVHVNRIPCDGVIGGLAYRPGKFFNASLDKASEFNERQGIRLTVPAEKGGSDRDIAVVQIAGLVARRIKCDLVEGQSVKAGQRLGLIRFGSRVDVYLPEGVEPLVAPGQRAVAGETVIADFRAREPARPGEIR